MLNTVDINARLYEARELGVHALYEEMCRIRHTHGEEGDEAVKDFLNYLVDNAIPLIELDHED